MDQTAYNIEQYILGMLGMGITIPTAWREYAEHIDLPFSNEYLSQTVTKLKAEGKVRVADKRVYLKPRGIEALKEELGEVIYEHYMTISNDHKLNDLGVRDRILKVAKAITFFLGCGGEVDGIRLEYRKNFLGKTRELDELIKSVEGGESQRFSGFSESLEKRNVTGTSFYSIRYIKKDDQIKGTGYRSNLSKSQGLLLVGKKAYMVFTGPKEISLSNENQLKMILELKLRSIYRETIKLDALILASSREDIKNIPEDFREIFEKVVVAPINNTKDFRESDGRYIIDILKTEDISDYLYYETERIGGISDGKIKDRYSWEIISGDFSKLDKIKRLPEDKIHIICYGWQKEIIDEIVNKDITYMVLDDKRKAELKEIIGG